MIADGILPSNEGRGYVLRRLLRRAVMKGHSLGIEGAFLANYIDKIIELMGKVYPELVENRRAYQACVVLSEEERFGANASSGPGVLGRVPLPRWRARCSPASTAFVSARHLRLPGRGNARKSAKSAAYTVDEDGLRALHGRAAQPRPCRKCQGR